MLIDDRFLDDLTEQAKRTARLRVHYDLRDTSHDDSMRMLNALEPGTVIPVHRHRDTSEDVIVLRGCVEEILFDSEGTETARYHLESGSSAIACHVPAGQYHTCVSLRSGSVIAEFKNGRYDEKTTEDKLFKTDN